MNPYSNFNYSTTAQQQPPPAENRTLSAPESETHTAPTVQLNNVTAPPPSSFRNLLELNLMTMDQESLLTNFNVRKFALFATKAIDQTLQQFLSPEDLKTFLTFNKLIDDLINTCESAKTQLNLTTDLDILRCAISSITITSCTQNSPIMELASKIKELIIKTPILNLIEQTLFERITTGDSSKEPLYYSYLHQKFLMLFFKGKEEDL